jgi:outer membrane receptor protein involved in Fe transport
MRERLMASSMICGAALAAAVALPATAQAQAASSEVQEVVVTGTRLPTPNLSSVSPIQVVTDQEIKLQGKQDIIDLINQLPQNFQNAAIDFSGTSNPLASPGGISTADLRGLGPQRTLVLVDGRRLGIGDANTGNPNPAPDLNQIPAPLVERVDVLTGGASATYGSDAVAGVVNFIMKHNFDGIQIDGQFGIAQHSQNDPQGVQGLLRAGGYTIPKGDVWDGRSKDLSIVAGTNGKDGAMNVTAYLVYHKQDPVSQSTRDYSACQIRVRSGTTPFCNGSTNSNQFFQQTGSGPGIDNPNGFAVVGHSFVDFTLAPASVSPPLVFNANPYQYLQHDDERISAGFFSHYDVNANLTAYADFSFMNDRSVTAVAPSGLFQGGGPSPLAGYTVNCNNPLLSAQQAATLCSPAEIASGASVDLLYGRRNIEGGPRASRYEHQNYRGVVGIRGELPEFEGWKYDLYGSYYYTTLFQSNENYLSNRRIQNALQVVNVNGVPTCTSVVNGSDTSCIPYNIFTEGGVTPAQVAYLNSTGTSYGKIVETIVEGNLTGDLGKYGVKSPWADDGVAVSLGVQDRRQDYSYHPDQNELSNDLSGFGGAGTIIDASLGVTEAYGEFRAPIAQDKPWMQELSLEGGYRYSKYSTDVKADTYKVGLTWAPVSDIRFRASFNRAIRAPNILELYNPQAVTNTSVISVDPCAPTPTGPATATLAQCQNTGVTAAQYGNGGSTNHIIQCPAGQCAVLQGGNPALTPERAKTYTVGFTVRPSFLAGFTGSLDYWLIKQENTIATVPLAFSLTECLNFGRLCQNVVRSPNGILFGTSVTGGGYVVGTAVNIGAGETSGIDLQANYKLPLSMLGLSDDMGNVQFNFVGSALLKVATTPTPGGHTYDCVGLYGPTCAVVSPKWRHTLRASWQTPWNLLASAQWRYIGSTDLELNTNDPTLGNGRQDSFDAKLKAVSYLDLAGIWDVRDGFEVRFGVNNVFDKDPQILNSAIVGTGLPNAYPTYDFLGRTMFVGFTANF